MSDLPPPPGPARERLRVQGIVQGVGFRPFVLRLARELGLTGRVENTSRGVEIEAQGSPEALAGLRARLAASPPPMAAVFSVEAEALPPRPGEERFEIRASRVDPVASAVIPPDIATCGACLRELADPADRRAGYPFLNCTDCGPRYSIIASIPYDRPRTSMAGFALCAACAAEYADPDDRRFHAQPNACPACGPRLALRGPGGEERAGDPLEAAVRCLREGGIAALLGLGGFHLACDARSEAAVSELRRRKARPAKPLAVMVPDLDAARALAVLDAASEALLAGPRAPILLAPARPGSGLAPSVAPGQDRVGGFLPYTPLHHLLFRRGGFPALVMTSGNRSDEPILATWEEARERLSGVADLFVLHDRPILHRVDDSVVKAMPSGPVVLRRARGYAPAPVPLANPRGGALLALGAELGAAVCVVRGPYAYGGPHVGDLKNLDTEEAYRAGIRHLLDLLRVEPGRVACDLHPQYVSSRVAREWEARGVEVVRVQHHEAHAAACMAEHGFEGEALALALDGLGHGRDGTVWGGEILAGRPGAFRRVAHLAAVPQPGGDRAAREPWRMAASHLRRLRGPGWRDLPLPCFRSRPTGELDGLEAMMARGVNAPATSSCGRLFDAAAAVLGFAGALRYSAQAAMELEALASRAPPGTEAYPAAAPAPGDPCRLLDPGPLLAALVDDALGGRDAAACALAFHRGLAALFARAAAAEARAAGLSDVFLTGGCLQNAVFARHLGEELRREGLRPRFHREVPPNDGGIAFGQAAWALAAGHS